MGNVMEVVMTKGFARDGFSGLPCSTKMCTKSLVATLDKVIIEPVSTTEKKRKDTPKKY